MSFNCTQKGCSMSFKTMSQRDNHVRLHTNSDRQGLLKSVGKLQVAVRTYSNRQVTDDFSSKFAGFITLDDDDLFYGNYAVRPHATFPISICGFESLEYPDCFGPNKSYYNQSSAFIRDVHFSLERQASLLDYEGSGYCYGHINPAGDYRKNEDGVLRTYVIPNCVPLTSSVNREVEVMEEEGRTIARDNWKVLIATPIILPDGEITLKLGKSDVPIPERVGKVFLYRNSDGLHLRGRRSSSNIVKGKDVDTLFDPFELLASGGIPCDLDKRAIRTINGVKNSAYQQDCDDSSLLPLYDDFFRNFRGGIVENEIGCSRARQRQTAAKKLIDSTNHEKVPEAKKPKSDMAQTGSAESSRKVYDIFKKK